MWEIKEDIAKYSKNGFNMIVKLKLIAKDGVTDIKTDIIYNDKIENPTIIAMAMRELGEKIQSIGIEKFQKYTYRHCEFCGELFNIKNSKQKYCSQKCRTAAHRVKEDIKNGDFDEYGDFIFKNGKITFLDECYDTIKYNDTTAKIFLYSPEDEDDECEDELYNSLDKTKIFDDIQYYSDGTTEHCVIFDKEGDEPNHKLMFIYETFWQSRA